MHFYTDVSKWESSNWILSDSRVDPQLVLGTCYCFAFSALAPSHWKWGRWRCSSLACFGTL